MSYYPPEVTVYEIIEWLGAWRIRATEITAWETGRKTKVVSPEVIFARRSR